MTNDLIFNQFIERVLPGTKDDLYSTVPVWDWDNVTYDPVGFPVSVQPSSSTEGGPDHPQTVTRLRLITPPGTDLPDLVSEARVRVGGVMVCTVVGEPAHWPDPWRPGVVHHLEAELEVVRG